MLSTQEERQRCTCRDGAYFANVESAQRAVCVERIGGSKEL